MPYGNWQCQGRRSVQFVTIILTCVCLASNQLVLWNSRLHIHFQNIRTFEFLRSSKKFMFQHFEISKNLKKFSLNSQLLQTSSIFLKISNHSTCLNVQNCSAFSTLKPSPKTFRQPKTPKGWVGITSWISPCRRSFIEYLPWVCFRGTPRKILVVRKITVNNRLSVFLDTFWLLVDKQTNERTNQWTNEQTNKRANERTKKQTN